MSDPGTRRPTHAPSPAKGQPDAVALDLSGFEGLSEEEAADRLKADGPNELPSVRDRGLFRVVSEVAREPMFLMLVAAGALYLFMGELGDALMLLGFVFVVVGITIVQERRTERALEALRDMSSPRALVIRGGRHRRIPGREVVRGDVLVLAEGDRVPADALLRRTISLSVDESLLTGESVPVRKAAAPKASLLDKPGGDDLPAVFSGTLVTAGQGLAEVVATGSSTALGRIGKALERVHTEATPLQKETGRFVKVLAAFSLVLCAVAVAAYAVTRGGTWADWRDGLLAGIAMAMSMLPEEVPVVLTVFLAIGAWRISRHRVLTRRMPAVETLGAATVLCVDKTGTLTLNRMTLRRLVMEGRHLDLTEASLQLSEEFHPLMENAILASKRDPFDPMERALHEAGDRFLADTEHLHPEWAMIREYPLTSDLPAVSHGWRSGGGDTFTVASKGAPEAIADLCHLPPEERAALDREVTALGERGLRVLAVASTQVQATEWPDHHHGLPLKFLGLLGFEDPLRPGVPEAVAECRTAGIRVVMVTGDYPATAMNISRSAGISGDGRVITGPEIDRMTDAELAERSRTTTVFARVVPEQKLRIVAALKAVGEVVAMTGDGVNDAPALKAAHIGVAMGGRGTDVAREASSLVLLDDDFASIVAAVRMGRRIYDNIRKAVAFIVAVHVPIAGLSLLPVFFSGWPLLLLPVHIVFLELVIDPTCSLVFEAEEAEADVMMRPPRDPARPLFTVPALGISLLQGLSVLVVCLGVFLLSGANHSADTARALTFSTLVAAFLALILTNRSWSHTIIGALRMPNAALWWVAAATVALLAAVLSLPALRNLFHFAPLHGADLALSLAAGAACVAWFEMLKAIRPGMSVEARRRQGLPGAGGWV